PTCSEDGMYCYCPSSSTVPHISALHRRRTLWLSRSCSSATAYIREYSAPSAKHSQVTSCRSICGPVGSAGITRRWDWQDWWRASSLDCCGTISVPQQCFSTAQPSRQSAASPCQCLSRREVARHEGSDRHRVEQRS